MDKRIKKIKALFLRQDRNYNDKIAIDQVNQYAAMVGRKPTDAARVMIDRTFQQEMRKGE